MQQPSYKLIVSLLITGVFILGFLLQSQVPTMADDLCRHQTNLSLPGTLSAITREYTNWTGRYLVIGFNYFAFSSGNFGIQLLNMLNAACLAFALYVCTRLHQGRNNYHGRLIVGACFIILIALVPTRMGELWLWKTGAVQYFWGSTMALVLIASLYTGLPNRLLKFICCVIAFVLGTWLENLSAACLLVVSLMLLVETIQRRRLPEFWKLACAGLLAVGLVTLVAAPGNYARADAIGDPRNFGESLSMAFKRIPDFFHPVLAALLLGFVWLNRGSPEGKRQIKLAGWLAAVGLSTSLMMSFAPPASFVVRAGFPQEFFLICAVRALFPVKSIADHPRLTSALTGVSLVAVLWGYWIVFMAYQNLSYQQDIRNQLTDMAIEFNATKNVALPPLFLGEYSTLEDTINDRWFFVRDIRESPEDWRNVCYAKAHGVESVQLVQFPGP